MTPSKLMAAAMDKKSVTGFHVYSQCVGSPKRHMSAAFLIGMPFRVVMSALPRIKIYKPVDKRNRKAAILEPASTSLTEISTR